MRAEIVGCYATCSDPLGMESGAIPDGSITASSFFSEGHEPYLGRLNVVRGHGVWLPKHNSIGEWLQVDIGQLKRVMGTIIQGRPTNDQRVTSYKLQYSKDRITWTTYAGSDGSEMGPN
ncbi:lactadherin-like [Branchiostoma lanceolatum]|uniref:lactadherin-like n=1 Tax=Branchiostoma lanceolatum TaxID=7740 RepID=UPI0034522F2F